MKLTVKEEEKLCFDIATNADTIRFFIDIQWPVYQAKHTTRGYQTRINFLKGEGTMFCNVARDIQRFMKLARFGEDLISSGR